MSRLAGAILLLTAFTVGVHVVIEPLYHVTTETQPFSGAWTYIDMLMALSVALGLICSWMRKRGADASDGGVSREYLEANVQFFGFVFVGILFFWAWFALLMNDQFTSIGPDTSTLIWTLVDAGLAILCGSLGMHLWKGSGDAA